MYLARCLMDRIIHMIESNDHKMTSKNKIGNLKILTDLKTLWKESCQDISHVNS